VEFLARNALTINLALSTLIFWLIVRIYLFTKLPSLEPRVVLVPILLLHSTRHLGLMFLAPGATYAGLPSRFAYPAALGDFLAAILALIALQAVLSGGRMAKCLVWIFNLEGLLDLAAAITLATLYDAAPFMGAAYWIPALWVPALLVTHFLTFKILRRPWPGAA
jgi:hypothetical protein